MTDPFEHFDALRARYARSFASKHKAFGDAWHALENAPDAATARELQLLVHRLAGSLPAYGYAPLGALASSIDCALLEWQEKPPAERDDVRRVVDTVREPVNALLDELLRQAPAA